ncbi:hypothetical protein KI387_021097, partial [Taxus chinensis]
ADLERGEWLERCRGGPTRLFHVIRLVESQGFESDMAASGGGTGGPPSQRPKIPVRRHQRVE